MEEDLYPKLVVRTGTFHAHLAKVILSILGSAAEDLVELRVCQVNQVVRSAAVVAYALAIAVQAEWAASQVAALAAVTGIAASVRVAVMV